MVLVSYKLETDWVIRSGGVGLGWVDAIIEESVRLDQFSNIKRVNALKFYFKRNLFSDKYC